MSRVVPRSLVKRACAPTLPELAILVLAMLSAGCADSSAPVARRSVAQRAEHNLSAGTANVSLSTSNAAITQTSNTAWTLARRAP